MSELELFVGSIKLVALDGSTISHEILANLGINIELNLEKVNSAFQRSDVQQALKIFISKNGTETSIILQGTPLRESDRNKYRTHSLRVNTKYRQKPS